jgi:hypothetical protein
VSSACSMTALSPLSTDTSLSLDDGNVIEEDNFAQRIYDSIVRRMSGFKEPTIKKHTIATKQQAQVRLLERVT